MRQLESSRKDFIGSWGRTLQKRCIQQRYKNTCLTRFVEEFDREVWKRKNVEIHAF